MQQNRLTIIGPPRSVTAFVKGRQPGFRYQELLEQLPGRYAIQFESDLDPLLQLRQVSRQKPGLIFLLEYERRRIKGLARLHGGNITRHEIRY